MMKNLRNCTSVREKKKLEMKKKLYWIPTAFLCKQLQGLHCYEAFKIIHQIIY